MADDLLLQLDSLYRELGRSSSIWHFDWKFLWKAFEGQEDSQAKENLR